MTYGEAAEPAEPVAAAEPALAEPMEDKLPFDAEAVSKDDRPLDPVAEKREAIGGRQRGNVLTANACRDIQHAGTKSAADKPSQTRNRIRFFALPRAADAGRGTRATMSFQNWRNLNRQ